MIKTERHKNLIELLESEEVMAVADLSEKLSISAMTIRRDLEFLEKKGTIKKLHGGAVLLKNNNYQPSFQQRINEYYEYKVKIGKEAAKLIQKGSAVFFDAGTTTLAIVDNIPENLEFTAITTGLMTAVALCNKPNINVVNIGGNIHHTSYSSINHVSIEMIKKFNADMAFITTKAFCFPEGTYEAFLPLIEIKRAIVSVSEKIILLADHSKFDTKSLSFSIPLNDIDMFITDSLTPKSVVDKIREIGKEIHIVE